MKTLKIFGMATILGLFLCVNGFAQKADVTVIIKGVKEVKGKIMVAAGDKTKPEGMIGNMIAVSSTDAVTCVLKNVPVGKTNIYVFQDMNENSQLDMDEKHIPIEPCSTKEKVTIKEGENTIEVKLVNIKEMMGSR